MWLVPGALCIICGLVLAVNPESMAAGVCRLIGIVALISGVVEFINERSGAYRRSAGLRSVLSIAAGAVLLFMPGLVLRSISLVAGVIIAAYALTQLLTALEARKYGRATRPLAFATPICLLILSVIIFSGGISVTSVIIRLCGIVMIIYGLRMLASAAPRN